MKSKKINELLKLGTADLINLANSFKLMNKDLSASELTKLLPINLSKFTILNLAKDGLIPFEPPNDLNTYIHFPSEYISIWLNYLADKALVSIKYPDKLTVKVLSNFINTHPKEGTIRKWTSQKKIPFHEKDNKGHIYFYKKEVEQWLRTKKGLKHLGFNKEYLSLNELTFLLPSRPSTKRVESWCEFNIIPYIDGFSFGFNNPKFKREDIIKWLIKHKK